MDEEIGPMQKGQILWKKIFLFFHFFDQDGKSSVRTIAIFSSDFYHVTFYIFPSFNLLLRISSPFICV